MPARTPQPPALVQFRSEAGLTLLIESIAQQYGCDMDAEDRSELMDCAAVLELASLRMLRGLIVEEAEFCKASRRQPERRSECRRLLKPLKMAGDAREADLVGRGVMGRARAVFRREYGKETLTARMGKLQTLAVVRAQTAKDKGRVRGHGFAKRPGPDEAVDPAKHLLEAAIAGLDGQLVRQAARVVAAKFETVPPQPSEAFAGLFVEHKTVRAAKATSQEADKVAAGEPVGSAKASAATPLAAPSATYPLTDARRTDLVRLMEVVLRARGHDDSSIGVFT